MNTPFLQHQSAESRAVAGVESDTTPAKRYARSKLQTAADIGNEMAKIYRLAKSGEMDASIATKLRKVCTTTAEAALLLVDISDDDISRHF